jgi:hypothetical protein
MKTSSPAPSRISMADVYFSLSSIAWRRNKTEIFATPGSSGIFEYKPFDRYQSPGAPFDIPGIDFIRSKNQVSMKYYGDLIQSRIQYYRDSKSREISKVPKELASIREQSLIPVYMDQPPPRKCRIISSSSTS